MKRAITMVALIAVPCAASAQSAGVSAARGEWRSMTAYIQRAAEQMPEADYAYKPVATVRSFGELIGHVAGAQKMFCAAALGEQPGAEDDIEKSAKTKAALVAALKETTQYCEKAYGLTDAQLAGNVMMFGEQQSKLAVLVSNAGHNAEHYGNIVTYMRIKGMTPPSSQPSK